MALLRCRRFGWSRRIRDSLSCDTHHCSCYYLEKGVCCRCGQTARSVNDDRDLDEFYTLIRNRDELRGSLELFQWNRSKYNMLESHLRVLEERLACPECGDIGTSWTWKRYYFEGACRNCGNRWLPT